jgi:hypothetical protein
VSKNSGNYDPHFSFSREMLALSIVNKLEDSGFEEVAQPDKKRLKSRARPTTWQRERIYERKVDSKGLLKIKVYTTVTGGKNNIALTVRSNGKDAIRVCGTYQTRAGKEQGVVSEKKVYRTGNIEEIVERMLTRMRQTWKSLKTGDSCKNCGAPKFVSKAGNSVCAEICWKSDEQKRAGDIARKTRTKRWIRNI